MKSLEKKLSCFENHTAAEVESSHPRVTFRAGCLSYHTQEFSSTVALLLTDLPALILAGQVSWAVFISHWWSDYYHVSMWGLSAVFASVVFSLLLTRTPSFPLGIYNIPLDAGQQEGTLPKPDRSDLIGTRTSSGGGPRSTGSMPAEPCRACLLQLALRSPLSDLHSMSPQF